MIFLQLPSPADTAQAIYNTMQQTAAAAETETITMNAFDLALKGGWLMIVLLILLLMSIYVLIERTLVINKAAKEDNSFMNRIKDYIHDGKIDTAINQLQMLCQQLKTKVILRSPNWRKDCRYWLHLLLAHLWLDS